MTVFKIGEIEYTITGKVSETAVNGVGTVRAAKYGWERINDIVVPEMVEHENKKYKVTDIYLHNCTRATIPSSVTSISLSGCENITIPSSVTSIRSLSIKKDITVPSSVTSIGQLQDCENITIPTSVTSIERIHRCKNITIPSSVTNISEVDGEGDAIILKMQSVIPPTVGKVIHMSKDDCLIVPKGTLDAYKSHPLWGKFKNITEDSALGEATVTSTPAKQPLKKSTEQTSAAKQPTESEMKALDRLIDAALEDFVVTDEERATLLKKADSIGLSRDEFKMILDSRIQRCMKEKPDEKIEEKKKGFFARLFGK